MGKDVDDLEGHQRLTLRVASVSSVDSYNHYTTQTLTRQSFHTGVEDKILISSMKKSQPLVQDAPSVRVEQHDKAMLELSPLQVMFPDLRVSCDISDSDPEDGGVSLNA